MADDGNKISKLDGFLYGRVDYKRKISGERVLFIYPDFQTGLLGRFNEGKLSRATAADIIAEKMETT